MSACSCGYIDSRFCPLHGRAMKAIIAAAEFGRDAAEHVAEAFADPEVDAVCIGCALGCGEHDCGTISSPARDAFMRFMWAQPGPDAADVRRWALNGRTKLLLGWVDASIRATEDTLRWYEWQQTDEWARERKAELAMFKAFRAEVAR